MAIGCGSAWGVQRAARRRQTRGEATPDSSLVAGHWPLVTGGMVATGLHRLPLRVSSTSGSVVSIPVPVPVPVPITGTCSNLAGPASVQRCCLGTLLVPGKSREGSTSTSSAREGSAAGTLNAERGRRWGTG